MLLAIATSSSRRGASASVPTVSRCRFLSVDPRRADAPLRLRPRPSPDASVTSARRPLAPHPLSILFTDGWMRFVLNPLSSVPDGWYGGYRGRLGEEEEDRAARERIVRVLAEVAVAKADGRLGSMAGGVEEEEATDDGGGAEGAVVAAVGVAPSATVAATDDCDENLAEAAEEERPETTATEETTTDDDVESRRKKEERVASKIAKLLSRAAERDAAFAESGASPTMLATVGHGVAMGLFRTASELDVRSPLMPPGTYAELMRRLPGDRFLDKFDVFRRYVLVAEAEAAATSSVAAEAVAEAEAGSGSTRKGESAFEGTKLEAKDEEDLTLDPAVLVDLCDSLGVWADLHHLSAIRRQRRRRAAVASATSRRSNLRWRQQREDQKEELRRHAACADGKRARWAVRWIWRKLQELANAVDVDGGSDGEGEGEGGDSAAAAAVAAYLHPCLPRLASSSVRLAFQNADGMSGSDRNMFAFVAEMLDRASDGKFPVTDPGVVEAYRNILSWSTVRTEARGAMKLHRLLSVLVREGQVVEPEVATRLLRNMYPFYYSTTRQCGYTRSVLRSIAELQRMGQPGEAGGGGADEESEEGRGSDGEVRPVHSPVTYGVDLGTLEHIIAASGQAGGSMTSPLVWDVAEGGGVDPAVSEGMFEGTIVAFLNSTRREDHTAFAVLADMEGRGGFRPSRALIKSVGQRIGLSTGRLDNAYYILVNETAGTAITTASLNCIVAGCARLGDAERAFSTLNDFERYGVDMDWDTLVFLMETLAEEGAAAARARHRQSPHKADGAETNDGRPVGRDDGGARSSRRQRLSHADSLMAMAEEWQLAGRGLDDEEARSSRRMLLHNYVRILCAEDELDAARELLEATATDGNGPGVHYDGFSLVAVRYAELGNFVAAWDVALRLPRETGYGYAVPGFVTRRIEKLERRHGEQFEMGRGSGWERPGNE